MLCHHGSPIPTNVALSRSFLGKFPKFAVVTTDWMVPCTKSIRATERLSSSSLMTSSSKSRGLVPTTSKESLTSAILSASATERCCPCEAKARASLPPMVKPKSSRCGPTRVWRLLSSSYRRSSSCLRMRSLSSSLESSASSSWHPTEAT